MLIIFFFFKQKTAYEMRISDWSSDVCSSDLVAPQVFQLGGIFRRDDEAELVTVLAATFLEGGQVGVVGGRAVRLPRLAVAADAFALDVAQVRDGRTRAGLLEIHQPHLDGGAARGRDRKSTRLNSSH